LQILQLTDLHLLSDQDQELWGINTFRNFAKVLRMAVARYPRADFLLLTGDLVHEPLAEAYLLLQKHLRNFPFPVYHLPGNHDDPNLIGRCLKGGNVRSENVVRKEAWQIVLLDSNAPVDSGGRLNGSQLQFLDWALATHPDHYALVCLHHHPVPIRSSWMDAMALVNSQQLFEVLDGHPQVRGIVWGHIHQEFETEQRGVRMMGTPATSVQFVPHCDRFAQDDLGPGFRWLRLHLDGRIETRVHYLDDD
ncbi:MAG: 3',5'-cyclic-AMP phosphodiesterase, partial [Gammaproteobacteria bacterium]|nr:3',5'-cyclic-AMP phosphodiesterase [Gammaproteobacteria bacterium]